MDDALDADVREVEAIEDRVPRNVQAAVARLGVFAQLAQRRAFGEVEDAAFEIGEVVVGLGDAPQLAAERAAKGPAPLRSPSRSSLRSWATLASTCFKMYLSMWRPSENRVLLIAIICASSLWV